MLKRVPGIDNAVDYPPHGTMVSHTGLLFSAPQRFKYQQLCGISLKFKSSNTR